jgi:hypothetical protein
LLIVGALAGAMQLLDAESVCFSMIFGNALGRSFSPSSNSSWCICFTYPCGSCRKPSADKRTLRMDEPGEVAKAASFLASDDSGFVTGVELFVDGAEHKSSLPLLAHRLPACEAMAQAWRYLPAASQRAWRSTGGPAPCQSHGPFPGRLP